MKKIAALICFVLVLFLSPSAMAASLSLDPNNGVFTPGCVVNVKAVFDPEGVAISGVDAILLYDTQVFKAASVTNGTVFNDYPGNTIDLQNGKVGIFALSTATNGVSSKGTLATIKLEVVKQASASAGTLRFDYSLQTPPKTSDSNIIEKATGNDILTTVNNATYTVSSEGTCPKAGATAVPLAQGGADTVEELPESGTQDLTFLALAFSGFFLFFGSLGFLFSKRKI